MFPSNSHAHYTSVSYLQRSLRQFSLLYHFPVTLNCIFFVFYPMYGLACCVIVLLFCLSFNLPAYL